MCLTRPQRLQQAHTQRRTRQPQLNASVLHELASLEFAFAALFAVSQRRDANVRLKSKHLLEPREDRSLTPSTWAKNSTFASAVKQRSRAHN